MRTIGNGLRNFEIWSSDEDGTRAGIPCPNYKTTPTGRYRALADFMCIALTSPPLHGGSSVVPGFDPLILWPRIHDHKRQVTMTTLFTARCSGMKKKFIK
ncbi:hypothetical protein TNCV_656261 [Trichonephila clavipes]|nr:hypothetical protein TNCV_656261 [Trichonephila clavipes]